jgi:hypothetical protein
VPTAAQREIVLAAASRGLPQDVIAAFVGVSESTLKRRCADELSLGVMAANARVAATAFEMATSGNHERMTMWWLRVRGGWK